MDATAASGLLAVVEHDTMRPVGKDTLRGICRDVSSIAMQLSEMKEELRSCVSAMVHGFQNIIIAVLQSRNARSSHTLADEFSQFRDDVTSQLERFRDTCLSQTATLLGQESDERESALVKSLHKAVLDVCGTSTRDRLHRDYDYTAVAPFSWNTCTRLADAVPYAVDALRASLDEQRQHEQARHLMHMRMEELEASKMSMESQLASLRTSVSDFISQVHRESGLTMQLCIPDNKASSTALTVGSPTDDFRDALRRVLSIRYTNELILLHHGAQPSALITPHVHRVEVVKEFDDRQTNEMECTRSHGAFLRKRIAQLRFRLAAQMVLNDLLKFRCRRVLSISNVHYRSLRVGYQTVTKQLHALQLAYEKQQRLSESTHVTKIDVRLSPTPPEKVDATLTEYWREPGSSGVRQSGTDKRETSNSAQGNALKPRPSTFKDYVKALSLTPSYPSQPNKPKQAQVVTSPPFRKHILRPPD